MGVMSSWDQTLKNQTNLVHLECIPLRKRVKNQVFIDTFILK